MQNITRFDALGLCGRKSDDENVLDSYIKTYEIKLNPETTALQFTDIPSPTAYLQAISAFVISSDTGNGALTIGFGDGDGTLHCPSINAGVTAIPLLAIESGGYFEYSFDQVTSGVDMVAVITVVGYDLDEN